MSAHAVDLETVKGAITGERFLGLVEALGGSLKSARRGAREIRIPCFLHGGSGPNLVLNPARGLWHCISSCDRGGDAIELVKAALGIDFPEALEWLAQWLGVGSTHFQKPGGNFREACPRASDSVPKGWASPGVDEDRSPSLADASQSPHPTRPALATPEPADVDPGPFLADVWSRVAACSWSGPVSEWLAETRGVEPDAAYALGCRDWSTARRDLADLVNETPLDVLEAVGLARDGRVHPAFDGCLRGDPSWSAVAVPVWPLGAPCPTRWRFRLLEARLVRGGGKVKVFGPYGGGSDLLGVQRPERLEAPEVRLAWLGSGTEAAGLVVLVEGEPDWWSATEVVDGRAVVVGVCGAPGRWRDEWPALADLQALGVQRIAVCVHRGSAGKDGLGHGERFARAVEGACARAGVAYSKKLAGEGQDLNDLHRAGALRGWLADVLEVTHGA